MQKLLPKLHGSKKKLGSVLEILAGFCSEGSPAVTGENSGQYPRSLEKIERMRKHLAEHGFTSFAEA